MVDVRNKRCSHNGCTGYLTFNLEGSKTGAFCKQNAEDGMMYIRNKRCSHNSCIKNPNFNVEGSKTAA